MKIEDRLYPAPPARPKGRSMAPEDRLYPDHPASNPTPARPGSAPSHSLGPPTWHELTAYRLYGWPQDPP